MYNCQCSAFICWNGLKVKVLLQAAGYTTKLHPVAESAVPLLTNCMLLGGDANLYSEYNFLCIRLNSSKIHSSNNNVAACAAPFIPLHTLQLLVQHAYQHPQPCIQHPLSFEYFTCCILQHTLLSQS